MTPVLVQPSITKALLFAVALAVPALAENMWVGGDFSYSANNSKVEIDGNDYDKTSSTSWSIAPEFGYSLNETWDIGLDLQYTSGQNVKKICGIEVSESPFDTTNIAVAPFARYHVAQIAGIDIMLKGSVFYASGEAKNVYYPGEGHYDTDYTAYGVSVAPVISYSINETWSIGATLNFAELSYQHLQAKIKDVPVDAKEKMDAFGFNLNDGSLISIGFSYHF